jgi:hypothetical protein
VHILAHGAPGRVNFAAGDWSAETLNDTAANDTAAGLAAIGEALTDDGDLRLWSCHVGEGGRGFVDALSRAAGAPVAAATNLIGSPSLGGRWELVRWPGRNKIPPPLTYAGMAAYAGVLSVILTSAGNGERLPIFGRWPASTPAGTYFIVLNNGGTLEVIGKFIVPVNIAGTFAISEPLPAGSYIVGSNTPGPGTITVHSGNWHPSDDPQGTWSLGSFNPAITATLNEARTIPSNPSNFSGAIGC